MFNYTGHKKLWLWLSENPDKSKWQWPEWEDNGGEYKESDAECFACDWMNEKWSDLCPLQFDEQDFCTGTSQECLGGLYWRWFKESDPKQKSKLALKIMNLKPREGVEWI